MRRHSARTPTRVWLEMPTSEDARGRARPKYEPEANAFVVHRGNQAYVSLDDETAAAALARHPDVHVLAEDEVLAFEADLPFPMPPAAPRTVGLGDVISRLTRTLGIRECGDCRRRRERFNKITVWRWRVRAKI